jgi:hypothetical protein
MKTMTFEMAIALMKTATNVQDWNAKRETIKKNSTAILWHKIYRIIDTEGFCVKTLTQNRIPI